MIYAKNERQAQAMELTKRISEYGGYIFDFDGTLVDSMDLWHEIDVAYLQARGLDCPGDLSYAVSGMSFTQTAEYFKERFALPDAVADIKAEWNAMSHQMYLDAVALKPGVREFLASLHAQGKPLAIATSNVRPTTEAYLKKHGLDHYFQALVFSCEVGAGKPDPTVFLEAARQLAVAPGDNLVFEDTLAGVRGAVAAGMTAVAVADPWQGDDLAAIHATAAAFIDGFDHLL